MPANPLIRRLITIPLLVVMSVVVTILTPVLIAVSVIVDVIRRLTGRGTVIATRAVVFFWLYLLGELGAVVALAATVVLPERRRIQATYRLQDVWTGWNLLALQVLFSLEIEVTGMDCIIPGPLLVLSRHASLVDTLLPAAVISRPTGMRLRYVLKQELLVDPALDIAGNRLPNAFIDRGPGDASWRAAIAALTTELGEDDGILIYPEGTRFSEAKLNRYRRRARGDSPEGALAGSLRRVLPPRSGGVLTLLDATDADVVVLAHHGLEGLATVRDVWSGALVGSKVSVRMWRISREDIPPTRSERVEWLYDLWRDVDDVVVSMGQEAPGSR